MRALNSVAFSLAVSLTTARPPVEKRQASPTVPATVGSFVYSLCAVEPFYNGIEARTLHGSSQISNGMTVELCASYCSGFTYFGVEYADECYCGNKVRVGTTQDLLGGCNTICSGNTSEYCGGSGRMNFYQQSNILASLTLPTTYTVATQTSVPVTGYKYIDCVAEPYLSGQYNQRALTGPSTSSSTMTVEACASYCAGYQYFGVEYSLECWCGNTLNNYTTIDASGCGCEMGCTGNDAEACGGAWHLNLYEVASSAAPTLATLSSATNTCPQATTSVPSVVTSVAATVTNGSLATSLLSNTTTGFVNGTVSYSTITLVSGSGSGPVTTTLPAASGATGGTVQVIYPSATGAQSITITSGYSTYTTTLAVAKGTQSGTVEVVLGFNTGFVTTTIVSSVTATRTITLATPSGTAPGTVGVLVPGASGYTVATTLYSGSVTQTVTLATPSGAQQGTLQLVLPTASGYTIGTTLYSGSVTQTITLATPSGSQQGTLELVLPTATGYTIASTTVSGSVTRTITLATPSGTNQGTLELVLPTASGYTVASTIVSGSVLQTLTLATPSGTNQGTLEVVLPSATSYTTISTIVSGSVYSILTLATPSGTNQGTVEVIVPSATGYTVGTTLISGAVTQTITLARPSGTNQGTLELVLPSATGYTTATTIVSGSVTQTVTLATPSGTNQGTVQLVIPTASGYVTTTSYLVSNGAVGYTSTIKPSGTVAGTVVVGSPDAYVTTYITSGTVGTTVTQTATGSATGTVQVYVAGPSYAACGNVGVQWAIWNNTFGSNAAGSQYSAFDPTAYKVQKPLYSSVTNNIGPFSVDGSQSMSVYGSPQSYNSAYMTIDHRGYFYADTTGTYTVALSNVDDIVLIWAGPTAYSGWKRSSADMTSYWNNGNGAYSQTVTLNAGSYTAFRLMWANGAGAGGMAFTITAPNGTTIVNGPTGNSIVQYGCGNAYSTAPAFAAWGSEP